jgi:hypothetical protein
VSVLLILSRTFNICDIIVVRDGEEITWITAPEEPHCVGRRYNILQSSVGANCSLGLSVQAAPTELWKQLSPFSTDRSSLRDSMNKTGTAASKSEASSR